MRKFLEWAKGFLSENGQASSKRFVGVFSAVALCWTLYANHDSVNEPSEALVYSVAALSNNFFVFPILIPHRLQKDRINPKNNPVKIKVYNGIATINSLHSTQQFFST